MRNYAASRQLSITTTVALMLVILPGVSFVQAGDRRPQEPAQSPRADLQEKTAAARQTINRLGLTRGQARQLLPVLDESAALHIEAYEKAAALLPETVVALRAFAAEDRLGQGFGPEVERRAGRLNRQLRGIREQLSEQLIDLEDRAASVLNRSQRRQLELDSSDRSRQPADPLAAAKQDLRELQRHKHPRVGKLGQKLLHPAAGPALCNAASGRMPETVQQALSVLERGTNDFPIARFEEHQAEVRRLRTEINNWNLINGLNLSRVQTEQILRLCGRAEPRLQEAEGKDRKALRDSLEQAIENVLNPGQREVLAEYKPCLVPPKNLKDPVRIGQASDRSNQVRWLERARKVSGDRLYELVERTLDREAEHLGELGKPERRDRRGLLLRIARRVAAMSEVDFEINKAELAEQIAPPDRVTDLRTEIDALARDRGLPGQVARFILQPQFLEQLRERGRQLDEVVTRDP